MLDQDKIALLRCPTTRQPLSWAEPGLVRSVLKTLDKQGAGRRRHRTDRQPAMEAALVTTDGELLYPIVRGIPKLLADEAIDLVALGIGPR